MSETIAVVTVTEGLTVEVEHEKKTIERYYRDLKMTRGIKNPSMITFTDDDVMRICNRLGVNVRQFKSLSRDDKQTVLRILDGVKSSHSADDEQTYQQAVFLARFENIFVPSKTKVNFIKDIQKLIDKGKVGDREIETDLETYIEEWFEDPEISLFSATPHRRMRENPAEMRLPYIEYFSTEICPTFSQQVDDQFMGVGDETPSLPEGGDPQDPNFLTPS